MLDPILIDTGTAVAVRVCEGVTLVGRSDDAPAVPVVFVSGQEIPNMAPDSAAFWLAEGAVERI